MMVDITGFTKLTELLTKRGPAGVELLTRGMNSCFSQVVNLVSEYEGDVTKLMGGSMIIAFYLSEEEKRMSANIGLETASKR